MQTVKITKEYQKLSDLMSLTEDAMYEIQNTGYATLVVYEGDSAPTEDTKGFLIDQNNFFGFKYDTELYLKGASGITEVTVTAQ